MKTINNSLGDCLEKEVDTFLDTSDCNHRFIHSKGVGTLLCVNCGNSSFGERSALVEAIKNSASERGMIISLQYGNLNSLFRVISLMDYKLVVASDLSTSKRENPITITDTEIKEIKEKINNIISFERTDYKPLSKEKAEKLLKPIDEELEKADQEFDYDKQISLGTKKAEILLLSGDKIDTILKRNRGNPTGKSCLARAVLGLMVKSPEDLKEEYGLENKPEKFLGTSAPAINESILLIMKKS